MIRVFIVDDHPVVIEGIHSLLMNEKDIAWVGQAMNAQSCLGFFVNNTADVVSGYFYPGLKHLQPGFVY
jgi:YesN/AraC family two-component response regulator